MAFNSTYVIIVKPGSSEMLTHPEVNTFLVINSIRSKPVGCVPEIFW